MQLATWNVNSLTVRLPQVLDWLQANRVDVLALQELKLTDDKFPTEAFAKVGYAVQYFGQKTYNGVAMVSRTQATAVVRNIPGFVDDSARVISGSFQSGEGQATSIRVMGAYFPNGQELGSDKFEYKMAWLQGLRDWLRAELQTHSHLVLMGDFNITFDDADVWDPVGMKDQIGCSDEERYHLQALVALGLHDAHRMFKQPPKSYSWWDYRGSAFRRHRGMRIDHILVSNALKPRVARCWIDTTPRKNDRPSDHTPVVLELVC